MASELIVQTLKGPTSGANANKILLGSGQELYAPGHVIQVVEERFGTTQQDFTGTAWADFMSASITPSSTSSKVLVQFNIAGIYNNNTASHGLRVRINRDSGDMISQTHAYVNYLGTNVSLIGDCSHGLLDAPTTTSQVTYALQVSATTANLIRLNANLGDVSRILLMEIAG